MVRALTEGNRRRNNKTRFLSPRILIACVSFGASSRRPLAVFRRKYSVDITLQSIVLIATPQTHILIHFRYLPTKGTVSADSSPQCIDFKISYELMQLNRIICLLCIGEWGTIDNLLTDARDNSCIHSSHYVLTCHKHNATTTTTQLLHY